MVQRPRSDPARDGFVTLAISVALLTPGCGRQSTPSPQAQIRGNWVAFFSPRTSLQQKEQLLQNGLRFARALEQLSGSSLARHAWP